MEFVKRVWAEQFVLTDEQKADIKAGKVIEWQGEPVKNNGGERFHVLLIISGSFLSIHENQWLVKDSPHTEILWDHLFKAKYSLAETAAPEPTKPLRSEALEAFLAKHKPAGESDSPSAPKTDNIPDTPQEPVGGVGQSEVPAENTQPAAEASPAETAAPEPTAEIPSPSLNGQPHD